MAAARGWRTGIMFALMAQLLSLATSFAAETTVTFSSNPSSIWNDGIAEDGDAGSTEIAGKVVQFYCISDTGGTFLNLPLVHGNSSPHFDGYDALSTYDASVGGAGFKGMAIHTQDGGEIQVNGFYYSNYGAGSPVAVTVKGFRNGSEVAGTTFSTAVNGSGFQSATVTLDSSFDDVDEVRLFSTSGTSWHGMNNIKIDDAVAVPPVTFTWDGGGGDNNWTTAANWVGDVAPAAGVDLVFPSGAARTSNVNDFSAGTVFRSITVGGPGYELNANGIRITGGFNVSAGASVNMNINLTLAGEQTWDVGAGGTLAYWASIDDTAPGYGITKTGAGTFYMFNDYLPNTYSGTTVVTGGDLVLVAPNGRTVVPADLVIGDNVGTGARVLFSGDSNLGRDQIADTATVTVNEGATLDLDVFQDTFTDLALRGATVSIGSGGTLTVTGGITNSASASDVTSTIQGPGYLDLNGGTRTVGVADDTDLGVDLRIGAIIANGAITKAGAGTLALAGDNTYTGETTIDAGRIRAESNNAFGDAATSRTISFDFSPVLELSGSITLPATKSLSFSGSSDRIVNVSGSNRILGSVSVEHDSNLNVASGSRLDLDGAVSSAAWVYKTGSGTLAFGGISPSFTGRTFVNAGTLLVNGSLAGTDLVPVSSGATLGGSGTVPAITVASGATLAPGTSPGILSSGNVAFSSGSTFSVELNGTTVGTQYDQLDVTGTVDLGSATLSVSLGFAPTSGDTFNIINNDGSEAITGTFNGLAEGATFTIGADAFQISYLGGTGNDVVLTYDPNTSPTDIALSNSSVNQSAGAGATVGTLSTTDPDGSDSHTYSLVSGTGDTDNALFTLVGDTLKTAGSDTPPAGAYSVRIRTDDGRSGTYEEAFAVTVATGTFVWSGAGSDYPGWNDPDNWVGGVAPGQGGDLVFPADAVRRESVNTLSAGRAYRSITIQSSGYDIYGEPLALTDGITTTYSGGTWFSLAVTLTGAQNIEIGSGGELYCFGSFSGAQSLTKTGAGTLRLANGDSNTHSGGTVVGAGTLVPMARGGAVAIPGSLSIEAGATVQFYGSTDYDGSTIAENQTASATAVTLGEGAVFDLNGRTNTIASLAMQGSTVAIRANGHLTVTGAISASANATNLTATIQGPGVLDLNGGNAAVTVADDADLAEDLAIGAVVVNGSLTKTGAGTLTLSGANTYAGATTVNAGSLRLTGSTAGTMDLGAATALTGTGTVGGTLSLASAATVSPGIGGPGTLTVGGLSFASGAKAGRGD